MKVEAVAAVAVVEVRRENQFFLTLMFCIDDYDQYSLRTVFFFDKSLCSAEVPSLCDGQEVDYWAVNRTLHFDDGVTRQVARVPIFDDSKYEGPPLCQKRSM